MMKDEGTRTEAEAENKKYGGQEHRVRHSCCCRLMRQCVLYLFIKGARAGVN